MLTVNELFAGIGSQRAALERLGIEHKVVGIAEIDRFATLSYAAIYHDLINQLKTYNFPSGEEMSNYLKERNIGFDFKKNKPFSWKRLIDKITGKGKKDLRKHYLASILSNNYGDISKVEKLEYADFWTYSFPCQDISVAGKQAGIEKGKTRSGLLYEVERLLEKSKECGELPKYLMLENVKNLVGKKFKPQFEEWITRLDELGYNTYWQVLNAKNYGIPQNRERVFGISIRKDIDTGYIFPEPFELKTRLKDILEDEVDEKFYLNEEQIKRLKGNTFNSANRRLQEKEYSDTLLARDYKDPKVIQVARYDTPTRINSSRYRTYSKEGISPTLTSMGGGNLEPHILEPVLIGGMQKNQAVKTDGISTCLSASMGTGGGYVPMITEPTVCEQRTDEGLRFFKGGVCGALRTIDSCGDKRVLEPKIEFGRMGRQAIETYNEKQPNYGDTVNPFNKTVDSSNNCPTITTRPEGFKTAILPVTQDYRIRKLTPKECWRLMGFTDEQFQKAQDAGVSNSQLYKQAGNSIVVDVLYYLFKNLFTDSPTEKTEPESELPRQMSIMDYL